MADRLTDAEIIERLRLVRDSANNTEAAIKLGLSERNLYNSLRDAKARGLTADSIVKDPLAKVKAENAALRQQVKQLERTAETAEAIRREIHKIAEYSPEPPAWLTKDGAAGFRGMPTYFASDWHYGEVVRRDEVGGTNEFNADIAAARIKRGADIAIDLCTNHMGRAKIKYPGIVFPLGGDMISGDIHEELTATNDRTPMQCVNDLTDLIAANIEVFATTFGRVFLPCVVGNHGRATRKPRMKGRVYTSFEFNLYCNLARHFRASKHIQFLIPNETDARWNVYGHRYLLTHGDSLGVKGGDGIIGALGPIKRGDIKVRNSEAQIGRDFDTMIMGHWHQYLPLPGLIVNNSLKGYDEYARLTLRAPWSRPSQALWFTHPEHGITAHWQVYVDEALGGELDKAKAKVLTWEAAA